MTLKEEAIDLINKLPDKVMAEVLKSLKVKADDPKTWETPEQEQARESAK